MLYDNDNIFRKIIDGKINCNIIYQDEHTIVIKDINPQSAYHYLIIPKGNYINIANFLMFANTKEIESLYKVIALFTRNENGSKLIINSGAFGKQEIPHLHIHILRHIEFKNIN